MEQPQEEVPEVREEEEEEEEAVMVASGASDPSAGPDSSLPSSSYTGEWSPGGIQAAATSSRQPAQGKGHRLCMGMGLGLV